MADPGDSSSQAHAAAGREQQVPPGGSAAAEGDTSPSVEEATSHDTGDSGEGKSEDAADDGKAALVSPGVETASAAAVSQRHQTGEQNEATQQQATTAEGIPATPHISGDKETPSQGNKQGDETPAVKRGSRVLFASKTQLLEQLRRGEELHEAEIYAELLQRVEQRRATQPTPLVIHHSGAWHGESLRPEVSAATAAWRGATPEAEPAAAAVKLKINKREVIFQRDGAEKDTTDVLSEEEEDTASGRRRPPEHGRIEIPCFKDDPDWAFQQFAGKRLDAGARFDDSLDRLYIVKKTESFLTQRQGKAGGLFFYREAPKHRYMRLLREIPDAIVDAKEFCCQMAALADMHRREEAVLNESDASCIVRLNADLDKTRRELEEHMRRLVAVSAFTVDGAVGDHGFALSDTGIAEEEILNPVFCPSDGLPLQTLAAAARSSLCSSSATHRGRRKRHNAAAERRPGGPARGPGAASGDKKLMRDLSQASAEHDHVEGKVQRSTSREEAIDAATAATGPSSAASAAAIEPEGQRIPRAETEEAGVRSQEEQKEESLQARAVSGTATTNREEAAESSEQNGNTEALLRVQNPSTNLKAAATEVELRMRVFRERLDTLYRVVWGEKVPDLEEKGKADTPFVSKAAAYETVDAVTAECGSPITAPASSASYAAAAGASGELRAVQETGEATPGAVPVDGKATEASAERSKEEDAALAEASFFEQDLTTQIQQLYALAGGEISDKGLNGVEARLELLRAQLEDQQDSLQQQSRERARRRQRQHQLNSDALAEDEVTALPEEWRPEKLVQKMHEALAPLLLPPQASEKVDRLHEKLSGTFASQKQNWKRHEGHFFLHCYTQTLRPCEAAAVADTCVVQLLLLLNRCEKQSSAMQASISASLQLLKSLSKASRRGETGFENGRSRECLDEVKKLRAAELGKV